MKKILKIFAMSILVIILIVIIGALIFLRPFASIPENPKEGIWYRVPLENTISSDGSPWYGFFKKGSQNKVLVYFWGGGVAVDEYTLQRPIFSQLNNSATEKEGFYFESIGFPILQKLGLGMDFIVEQGIGSLSENNPFKDWTIISVPYSTGDFHSGQNTKTYTDSYGVTKNVHLKGYMNYTALMQKLQPYLGNPEELIITGSSAGGFGTSLLADDVIGYFPNTQNIGVVIDGSVLIHNNWKNIAKELWGSPQKIVDTLNSHNLTLDGLKHISQKYGNRVKILFTTTMRDVALAQYQNYIDNKTLTETRESVDAMEKHIRDTIVEVLQLPNSSVYIWEKMHNEQTQSTAHTILLTSFSDEKFGNAESVPEWMISAMNGNMKNYGQELLNKKY